MAPADYLNLELPQQAEAAGQCVDLSGGAAYGDPQIVEIFSRCTSQLPGVLIVIMASLGQVTTIDMEQTVTRLSNQFVSKRLVDSRRLPGVMVKK
jgi:hypothetical protein